MLPEPLLSTIEDFPTFLPCGYLDFHATKRGTYWLVLRARPGEWFASSRHVPFS